MLTPAQIKQLIPQKDESGFYQSEQVDRILTRIADDYDEIFTENGNLIRKLSILAAKLDEYRKDENVLRDVLLNTLLILLKD